jgi:hypothetical protein
MFATLLLRNAPTGFPSGSPERSAALPTTREPKYVSTPKIPPSIHEPRRVSIPPMNATTKAGGRRTV